MTLTSKDLELIKTMCAIHAPSGNESAMKNFLLAYIKKNCTTWKYKPLIIEGTEWHDNIILIFGKPKTAIFSHIDSIGFTVRYGNQLVKIGGPVCKSGFELTGKDKHGTQTVKLHVAEKKGIKTLSYKGKRHFETGTDLVFKQTWKENKDYIQSCYIDNRLGVFNALKVAEDLKNGAIVFSTYEEHGGGSVSYIQKYLREKYKIQQALISDISWISDGVKPGLGPVISMRDSLIPRKSFVEKVIGIADKNKLKYQLEVEGSGGSDAKELQQAEYLWDWCFIGAAEQNVHTPMEKVHKKDIEQMILLYKALMKHL